MSRNRQLIRKFISLFSSLAISAGVLVGLSTTANAAAPGNNNFASATVLTPATPSLTGQTNVSATMETSEYDRKETNTGSNIWDKSVWYSWTPAASGNSTIDLCSARFKAVIAVYPGATALPTTAPSAGNFVENSGCTTTSDGAKLTLSVTSGTTYLIQISGKTGTNSGTFNLTISAPGSTPQQESSGYVELDRVTICHRTHATTNPYRIITVSASSIVGSLADGSPIRGHAKHATDARRYNPDLYGTYDSTKSYRPNAKLWGDIIPPFKDKSTGGIFPGLNWKWTDPTDSDSNAILDKTEFGNVTVTANSSSTVAQSAVDLCKGASGNLTSKQLFDLERKNGEKRKDILDEIADTDQYEPDVYKEKGNLDKELPANEGPKRTNPTPIAQSLDGTVWLDINRNGFQESNEPFMSNIQVTVAQGTSPAAATGRFTGFGTGAKFFETEFGANLFTQFLDNAINKLSPVVNGVRSLFGMAATYTVYTDKDGYFIFKSLASGDWYVAGVVPAGLDVTYDSAGVSDATVDTTVPAGGHASTWIGLMGDSTTGIKSLVLNPDGTPVTQDVVITASGIDGIFCNTDDVSFVITPVNGVIELSGLINSSYYVRQIGSTATIADFNITQGQIYTADIKTVKGTRCALLTGQQLAATGGNVDGISLAALLMLTIGTVATVIGVRKTRVNS